MQAAIRNQYLTLTVDTHGAEAVSVKNAAGQEMLWQADKAVWGRHAPILFPWTGKFPGGQFTHKGRAYKAGQHGFARDLEHILVKQTADTLVLELHTSAETLERWPFAFTLTSTFRLEGKTVHHTLTVTNEGGEAMPFGIGYHPAFAVPFDDAHDTGDYEFRFDQPESPVVIDARPNGLLSGKNYFQWKNARCIPLDDRMFDNDSYCMAGLRSATLGVYEKDTGRNITCDISGYPYTLIWSALSEKLRFVCIEPWHSLTGAETDTQEWNDRAAAKVLAPGEQFSTTLSTTFDR